MNATSIAGRAVSKYYFHLHGMGTQYFGRCIMVNDVNSDVYFSFVERTSTTRVSYLV